MTHSHSVLLSSFISWANKKRDAIRPRVNVEVGLGPPFEKRAAFMNFEEDEKRLAHIMVWDTSEFETEFENVTGEEARVYEYGETIAAADFDVKFRLIIEKFIM